MHLLAQIATLSIAAAVAASPTLKRQTPDRFTVFFGTTPSLPNQILVVDGVLVAAPATGYYNQSEPLILNSDFLFTSIFGSPADTQALIYNTLSSQGLELAPVDITPEGFTHNGFSIIDNELAINGNSSSFWACDEFVAPGGSFPLHATDPVDVHALSDGGCHPSALSIVSV